MSNELLYSGLSKKWITYVWICAPVHSRADKRHELVASLVHHKTAHCNKKVQHYALSKTQYIGSVCVHSYWVKNPHFQRNFKGAQAWDIRDRVIYTERSHLGRWLEEWTKKHLCKVLGRFSGILFFTDDWVCGKIIPRLLSIALRQPPPTFNFGLA